jgi:predicted ribonuclease YlaK
MKNYILFSFGEVSVKNTDNILNIVSKVSELNKILYQSGKSHLNIQFVSKNEYSELKNYFKTNVSDMTQSHYLVESDILSENDGKSVKYYTKSTDNSIKEQSLKEKFDDYLKQCWLESNQGKNAIKSLEESNKKFEKFISEIENRKKIDDDPKKEDMVFIQKLDSMISNFIGSNKTDSKTSDDFEESVDTNTSVKTKIKFNSEEVDKILDKIGQKGLSSLTKKELNYLNSISKTI